MDSACSICQLRRRQCSTAGVAGTTSAMRASCRLRITPYSKLATGHKGWLHKQQRSSTPRSESSLSTRACSSASAATPSAASTRSSTASSRATSSAERMLIRPAERPYPQLLRFAGRRRHWWHNKTPRRVRTSSAVADWAELAGLAGLAGWPGLTGLDHLAHVAGLAGLEIDHISRWVDGYQMGCRTPVRMGL